MFWGARSTGCSSPASAVSSSHHRFERGNMSAGTTQPLSLLHVDFDALYTRHLGRHSQWGINITHLLLLYALWFCVYAAVAQGARLLGLPASWPVVVVMAL